MEKKKYISLMMAIVCVLSLGFISCGDDDDDDDTPAPTVTIDEANIEGDELCVEADIVAPGKTSSIVINICDASSGTVKLSSQVTESKYINVLNVDDFHKHFDIAGKNVAVGDKLKFTVTDANGQSTTAEKAITEEEELDD